MAVTFIMKPHVKYKVLIFWKMIERNVVAAFKSWNALSANILGQRIAKSLEKP